jgi:hypothetical protein
MAPSCTSRLEVKRINLPDPPTVITPTLLLQIETGTC